MKKAFSFYEIGNRHNNTESSNNQITYRTDGDYCQLCVYMWLIGPMLLLRKYNLTLQ